MKILLCDIETAPTNAWVWGLFKENIPVDRIVEPGYILCWAAKWLGDKKVMFNSIQKTTEKQMLVEIHKLLDEADVVVGYNSKRFDIPHLNRMFLLFGLNPPSPYEQVDLYPIVKKHFRFCSNKLANIVTELGLGEKEKSAPFSMWIGCMNMDGKSWAKMEKYNVNDVVILEAVYNKLLPWIPKHPNSGLYIESDKPVCPNCGGTHLQHRGYRRTRSNVYRRYQCQDCGAWPSSRLAEKIDREHVLA